MRLGTQATRAWGWRAILVVLVVASSSAVAGPSLATDEGGPYASATSEGEAGCDITRPPFQEADCQSWEENFERGTGTTWSIDKNIGKTVQGASNGASGVASIIEVDRADGSLGSLTLRATMEATLIGGGGSNAYVEFRADFPVSTDSISVIGNAAVEGHGGFLVGGSGQIQVTVGCAEEPTIDTDVSVLGGAHGGEPGKPDDDSASVPINSVVPVVVHPQGGRFCYIQARVNADASVPQGSIPPTHGGSGKAVFSLVITAAGEAPSPSPSQSACALAGTAYDGDAVADGHDSPLVGIRVDLLRDNTAVSGPVATDADGKYCLPWEGIPVAAPGSPAPGTYEVRVALADAAHSPLVFHTRYQDQGGAVAFRRDVADTDWGSDEFDLTFTTTDAQPWLSDVARIHYESTRFVDWLLDDLLIPPADLAGLQLRGFDSGITRYLSDSKVAAITTADSPFAQRSNALAIAPENGEWHEIGHHLGYLLGVAPTATAATCAGRVNHGGWLNTSTCDSLSEGFAIFVPIVASLDLDAGRPGGYATSFYAAMHNLEDNDIAPWTDFAGASGARVQREDFAVAQLLWDLADDTAAEQKPLAAEPRAGGTVGLFTAHDHVALGGVNLIQLLKLAAPENVADIHDFLTTSTLVDVALRTADTDVDGDGSADLSPIDEIFLMHNFRPLGQGPYVVGSQIGHSPPGRANAADRRHIEPIPGSAVRLVNTGAGAATFTIEIETASGKQPFEVVVGPAETVDLNIELPPYWEGPLPADGALPECGAADEHMATLTVAALGAGRQTVDSCDYLHSVVESTDGVAMTVEAAGDEPVPTAEPTPTDGPSVPLPPAAGGGLPVVEIVAFIGLALLIVAAIAFFTLRRRRT